MLAKTVSYIPTKQGSEKSFGFVFLIVVLYPLTPYVVINDDYLIDPKFGGKYPLKNKLYVYESEDDLVREVSAKDVPELIKQQPIIVRHWVQLFKDTWVQNIIVWLSPRLVYLFE
jgi:hypothetical protein